jgi:hypothetical protein
MAHEMLCAQIPSEKVAILGESSHPQNSPLKLSAMATNDLWCSEDQGFVGRRVPLDAQAAKLVQEHALVFRKRHEVFIIAAVRG